MRRPRAAWLAQEVRSPRACRLPRRLFLHLAREALHLCSPHLLALGPHLRHPAVCPRDHRARCGSTCRSCPPSTLSWPQPRRSTLHPPSCAPLHSLRQHTPGGPFRSPSPRRRVQCRRSAGSRRLPRPPTWTKADWLCPAPPNLLQAAPRKPATPAPPWCKGLSLARAALVPPASSCSASICCHRRRYRWSACSIFSWSSARRTSTSSS